MSKQERYLMTFDFETTGLPLDNWGNFEPYPTVKKWSDGNPIMERIEKKNENGDIYYERKMIQVDPSKPENWPHAVQLSYLLYDKKENKILKIVNEIVRLSEGTKIEPSSMLIHKISYEKTQEKSNPEIKELLEQFMNDFRKADIVSGHNVSFDKNILLAEMSRLKNTNPVFEEYIQEIYFSKKFYCTGMYGKEVCKIEAVNKMKKKYFKMPKLKDLYRELFGYYPDESKLHNAFMDVVICFRCFYKMCFEKDICDDPLVPSLLLNLYNDISPSKNKIYRMNDLHIMEEFVPRKSQRLLSKIKKCYVDKKTRRKI